MTSYSSLITVATVIGILYVTKFRSFDFHYYSLIIIIEMILPSNA